MTNELIVDTIYSNKFYIKCPVCSERVEGWWKVPKGCSDKCDSCGAEFKVAEDAVVTSEG